MDKSNQLECIHELLRRIGFLINPIDSQTFLNKLSLMGMRKYESLHPHCFFKSGKFLFPLCGQFGSFDTTMIRLSIKILTRLKTHPKSNLEELELIERKLLHLEKKFSADVPKPIKAAVRKAIATKKFNKNMNR